MWIFSSPACPIHTFSTVERCSCEIDYEPSLHYFQVFSHNRFLHMPSNVHRSISMRRHIIHQTKTMKRTSVAESIFFLFTYKQHNFVVILWLHCIFLSAIVVVSIFVLRLPVEKVLVDYIIIILSRRRKILVRFVERYKKQCSIVFIYRGYSSHLSLHFLFCRLLADQRIDI